MTFSIFLGIILASFTATGNAQANFGGAYRPGAGTSPRTPQPFSNNLSPFNSNTSYRPAVVPRQNELRTASNLAYPQPENLSDILVAQIQGHGVFGFASFHPMGASGGSHVTFHVSGGPSDETYLARIYELPLQNGAACTPISLGSLVNDFSQRNGVITPGRATNFQVTELNSSGSNSIMGRTLLLQGLRTGVTICSVIMPGDDRKLVFQGKFHVPVAGMAYYIQNDKTAVLGTEWMMFSDGTRRDARYQWQLIRAGPGDANVDKKINNEKAACANLQGDIIESSNQPNFPVSTETPIWKGRMHIGLESKINRNDVIYLRITGENGVPVACTSLNRIDPKEGLATFDSREVQGTIKFTQDSPYEPTRVSIDLNLATPAFSYGIDVLPSIRRRKVETKTCPNIKETIYNPFHVDPESVPGQGMGTTDQYATGDLSGKFGTLENQQTVKLQTWDVNLPLFGYYSVIGRAIVIYGPQGPPVACANIDLAGKALTTAYSTFDSPVQGQFIFRQPEGECFSDTYLYIEVSRPPTLGKQKTVNHNWHVHTNSLEITGDRLSSTDCAQAASHYNPYNVSTSLKNPIYVRDCSIFTPTRCEVGDTAHKLGTIDIPPYKPGDANRDPEVAKYYWIDSDLPLCGPNEIVGRSIVIHDEHFQMKRISCANLLLFRPPKA